VIELPDLDLSELNAMVRVPSGPEDGDWVVILYNCDCHTYDDVINILMKAIQCSADDAYKIAYEVDTKGSSVCFRGNRKECERVHNIIASIKLQVEMDRA